MGRTEQDQRFFDLVLDATRPQFGQVRSLGSAYIESAAEALRGSAGEVLDSVCIERTVRADLFGDPGLFGEPAWDILLRLATAERQGETLTIASLCAGLPTPINTTIRWVQEMVRQGYIHREDRREGTSARAYLSLSANSRALVVEYLKRVRALRGFGQSVGA